MPDLSDLTNRIADLLDHARITTDLPHAVIQDAEVFGRNEHGEPYDPRGARSTSRPLTVAEIDAAVDRAQEGLRALPALVAAWGAGVRPTTAAEVAASIAQLDEAAAVCPVLVSAFPGLYLLLPAGEFVSATWINGPVDHHDATLLITALRRVVGSYVYRRHVELDLAKLSSLLDEMEQPA